LNALKRLSFTNCTKTMLHPGHQGLLSSVGADLTCIVFELKEQEMQLNTRTVCKEASRLCH